MVGTLSGNLSAKEFLSVTVPQIRRTCESQKMYSNILSMYERKRFPERESGWTEGLWSPPAQGLLEPKTNCWLTCKTTLV